MVQRNEALIWLLIIKSAIMVLLRNSSVIKLLRTRLGHWSSSNLAVLLWRSSLSLVRSLLLWLPFHDHDTALLGLMVLLKHYFTYITTCYRSVYKAGIIIASTLLIRCWCPLAMLGTLLLHIANAAIIAEPPLSSLLRLKHKSMINIILGVSHLNILLVLLYLMILLIITGHIKCRWFVFHQLLLLCLGLLVIILNV